MGTLDTLILVFQYNINTSKKLGYVNSSKNIRHTHTKSDLGSVWSHRALRKTCTAAATGSVATTAASSAPPSDRNATFTSRRWGDRTRIYILVNWGSNFQKQSRNIKVLVLLLLHNFILNLLLQTNTLARGAFFSLRGPVITLSQRKPKSLVSVL